MVLEGYYEFNEFNLGQVVKRDYCHKQCWEDFKKGVGNVDEAMGMLRGLKSSLVEKGILPEPTKEYVIK